MNNDFFKSYQTAEWQRLKNRVLERDNYTCQICGEKSGLMQVHHITYKNCRGKAYNAPMGDLITLCECCHANDDGDHKHFFHGDITLSCGCFEDKPSVFSLSSYLKKVNETSKWYGEIGEIIFAKCDRGNDCIGFRPLKDYPDWFDYFWGANDEGNMWGYGELQAECFHQQRHATFKEVDFFVQKVEECIPTFGDMVRVKEGVLFEDVWYVDLEKYLQVR